jgi:hypothetical protein
MADTDIDAVRKQKKTEYDKQYSLKHKLLLQASTSTETELAEKQKKAEYDKQYRMKRKLLLQQQAFTSSETELVRKQKKAEYVNKVQPICRKMIRIAAIRVTCL